MLVRTYVGSRKKDCKQKKIVSNRCVNEKKTRKKETELSVPEKMGFGREIKGKKEKGVVLASS